MDKLSLQEVHAKGGKELSRLGVSQIQILYFKIFCITFLFMVFLFLLQNNLSLKKEVDFKLLVILIHKNFFQEHYNFLSHLSTRMTSQNKKTKTGKNEEIIQVRIILSDFNFHKSPQIAEDTLKYLDGKKKLWNSIK